MNKIHLQFSTDETNIILEALGSMPFSRVYGVINEIQQQAAQQLHPTNQHEAPDQNSSSTLNSSSSLDSIEAAEITAVNG